MHIAWCCLEEVRYCFSRSSVKFQGHTAKKIVNFDPNWAFPDCNSGLFEFTNGYEMMHKAWSSIGALLFFKVICEISRSHGIKNYRFWPKLAVSGLPLLLFKVICPVKFKVAWDKKLPILTQIELFQIVTYVWIYPYFSKLCTKLNVA